MAWSTTMVTMLRYLINDFSAEQTYGDSSLQQLLVVAAKYVKQEARFSVNYTITIDSPDISPDPTLTASLDDAFTNLTVLKSACLTDEWQYRERAIVDGISASCGDARIAVAPSAFKELLQVGPCKSYSRLLAENNIGNTSVVRAVLSPFRANSFSPLR